MSESTWMRGFDRNGLGVMLTMLAALALAAPGHAADPSAAEKECAALAGATLDDLADAPTRIISTSYVASRALTAEEEGVLRTFDSEATTASAPGACKVNGYVAPHVRFELYLPDAQTWNGKFMLTTCDGFCGRLDSRYCLPGLLRNYATATTDGGHYGAPAFEAVWAYNNPAAEIDFGYRANHVVAVASKAIVNRYYGRTARLSYLTGCSKGGSAGVMAAMRYPEDFDGIVAASPVLDYQGKVAIQFPWVARAVTTADDKPILAADKVPLIQSAVMAACDSLDGLRDGVIDDPRACSFDPKTLACSGKAGPSCLTAAEVNALRQVYAAPRNSKNEIVYPAGTIPGSEASWPHWVLPKDGNVRTLTYQGAEQYLRYMAFTPDPGPGYDFRSFDFDRDPQRLATLAPVYDATSPDLRAFQAAGGKLLIWHGWADSAISPLMTIRYYDAMTAFMGGRDSTGQFARLFLLPGVFHCGGGAGGRIAFDALTALEQWREKNVAPDRMLLSQDLDNNGSLDRVRPVFPYPRKAVYIGHGDINHPESFEAREP